MTEIFVQKNSERREIALLENEKLIEYYEEIEVKEIFILEL